MTDAEHLLEIEKRVKAGWRLQEDLEWMINFIRKVLSHEA